MASETARFFEFRSLEENTDGSNTKKWLVPALSNLPHPRIHPRDCRLAAVSHAIIYARLYRGRTIHDSVGFPRSHAFRRRDDIAITHRRREIYEFRSHGRRERSV